MVDRQINTDVIIVGKGISGLVLSLLLKRKGVDHVLLDRIDKRKVMPLPETLPPSALVLLESLNLLELFQKSASKTFGYHSIWGADTVTTNHFFNHNPYKYGLKLDKQSLLGDLEKVVKEEVVRYESLIDLDLSNDQVSLTLEKDSDNTTVNGRIIVDATGRNRGFLKLLDITSQTYDHQVALSCHLPYFKHPALVHGVFTESFENGWGIVSSLNEKVNCMTLFTQKGSPILPQLKSYQHWKTVLAETRLLKDFLASEEDRKVVGGNANSSKASSISGSNWLAIGDAAIAFDPVSSHGISNAVYTAHLAAKAIGQNLESSFGDHFRDYGLTLSQIFNEYLKQREQVYALEKRFTLVSMA